MRKMIFVRKIRLYIIFIFTCILCLSPTANAINGTYDQTFYSLNNIDFYNPTACSNGSSSATTSTPSPTGSGIYTITITNPRGSQFHGSNYAFEDSLDGVEYAHAHNYNSIDLDINKSKEGTLFAAHDPSLVGKPWATIEAGNSGRQYKVSQLSDLLTKTAQYGIQANLDLKPWGNTWDDATFAEIANLANSLNAQVAIKASTNDPNLANALSLAQNHGFWVRSNSGTYNGKNLSGNGWKPGVWVPPSTSPSGTTAQPVSSVSGNSCACQTSSASASLIGGSNLEKAYNYFIGKGLSPVQAAGAIGNIAIESHGDPTIIQGGSHTNNPSNLTTSGHAYGIIQWDPGAKLINLLKNANINGGIQLLSTQLDMVWWHLNNQTPTGFTGFLTQYKQITDVDQAASFWQSKMEGTTSGTPDRQKAAELALSQYSGSTSTSSSDSTLTSAQSCGSTANGAVTGNIVQTALNYAWSNRTSGNNGKEAKPSYAAAVAKAKSEGKYIGGCDGEDCGAFITRVMQDSGVDPNYGGGGNTAVQLKYLQSHPSLYQEIHPSSTADLQPGDIAIQNAGNIHHTYMYVGKQPGFGSTIASASECDHFPWAGTEAPADHNFHWFRYIGSGGDSTNA